jgi:hypothetical protein
MPDKQYTVSLTEKEIDHITDALNVLHIRVNGGVKQLLVTSDLICKFFDLLTH